jgi:hypothetical protein
MVNDLWCFITQPLGPGINLVLFRNVSWYVMKKGKKCDNGEIFGACRGIDRGWIAMMNYFLFFYGLLIVN